MAEENNVPKGYRYIGLGVVSENKPLGTRVILYRPVEENPLTPGDLVSENQRLESKYKDGKGVEQTAILYTNTSRDALWLPDDTFRLTAPDVRRGEKVRLYRYADKDLIFWKEMGDGKTKRRGESIILGASGRLNMANSSLEENDAIIEEHYRIEMSGHQRIINISTSAVNKEVSVYSLLLDGGNGLISLADAEGNELTLDTKKKRWAIRNNEGSYIVLDKQNIMIGSEDSVFMQSDKKIAIQTQQFFLKCEQFYLEAETMESSATTWNHKGNVNIEGNWTFTGTGKANGGLSVTQDITTDADVKTKTVSLNGHQHRAQGERAITTAPIAG